MDQLRVIRVWDNWGVYEHGSGVCGTAWRLALEDGRALLVYRDLVNGGWFLALAVGGGHVAAPRRLARLDLTGLRIEELLERRHLDGDLFEQLVGLFLQHHVPTSAEE